MLALGTAGDRSNELLQSLGAIGARGSDVMVIVHKLAYLRGRTTDELDELYRAGAAEVGVEEVPAFETEISGLSALMGRARPRDVVGLMCHQDRAEVDQWLRDRGASVDSPSVLRDKVLMARDDGDAAHP
jgi:cyanophycin synthetase